ncbi:MAG: energy transducer TonB, partial [Bradyrhizobium sp.]|nr:energy transducer TonB [Bradyrhizobium sp.]
MSDLETERRSPRWPWILAGSVALALHLGGAALALAHLKVDDGDDGLGANGAEYA